MRFSGKLWTLLSIVCLLLVFVSAQAFGQEEEKLKMDEYKAKLAEYESQEQTAADKIQDLTTKNTDLNQKIDDTQSKIDAEWAEIYALLGTDKAGVDAYRNGLDDIGKAIDGLAALSPEELYKKKAEIKTLEGKIAAARGSKLSYLSEMEGKLNALDGKLAALKAKMPASAYDSYTVLRGDYLWKIAKKPEIYGNPFQWITIYDVNKDQIKDADLIYPDQIFRILRGTGKDQYLVSKGDWLSKIAGYSNVFGDPTKWTKLYEANKNIISDPSLIYPYQVLTIPGE